MDELFRLIGLARGAGMSVGASDRGDIVLRDRRDETDLLRIAADAGWSVTGSSLHHPRVAMHVDVVWRGDDLERTRTYYTHI
ncbi:hypothetical protein [Flindersiella endophytica]